MALELWERRLRRIISQKTISNIITLPKTNTAA